GTKSYSGPKVLNWELKFATHIKRVFGEGVAAPVVPGGLPKVEVEEKNELRPVEGRDLAAISSNLELKEVNVSCPKLDEVSRGVDNDTTGEDESEGSESCSRSTANEATSEVKEVESEKEVKSTDDLDDSDLEEKETGQGTAKEVHGEGILDSSALLFTSVPMFVDVVDADKEQIAPPSGRGEDFPKAAITNIQPSAHNMFDKMPKKGLLQQKMRAVPVSEFSESEEDKSISGVDEDYNRIARGEGDSKMANFGVISDAPNVFDKRPLSNPEGHYNKADVKQDQDLCEFPSAKGREGLTEFNFKKS
ncbi:hypothetical protein U1Q18_022571, partial [Sarracenia purpurea var. burkii]